MAINKITSDPGLILTEKTPITELPPVEKVINPPPDNKVLVDSPLTVTPTETIPITAPVPLVISETVFKPTPAPPVITEAVSIQSPILENPVVAKQPPATAAYVSSIAGGRSKRKSKTDPPPEEDLDTSYDSHRMVLGGGSDSDDDSADQEVEPQKLVGGGRGKPARAVSPDPPEELITVRSDLIEPPELNMIYTPIGGSAVAEIAKRSSDDAPILHPELVNRIFDRLFPKEKRGTSSALSDSLARLQGGVEDIMKMRVKVPSIVEMMAYNRLDYVNSEYAGLITMAAGADSVAETIANFSEEGPRKLSAAREMEIRKQIFADRRLKAQ
jgi:hypothetical protein